MIVSQAANRNDLIAFQALMMVCLTASTSTPAFSSREPMSESLPCMKLMKSSTSRARSSATAMIARVLTLMLVSSFDMDDRPDVIY